MVLPLRMELTLRSFLLLLRRLVSFLHRRWDQSTRWLWYILSFVRSRSSSRHPKGDATRRSTEPRPASPPPAVICASRLPRDDSGTPAITSPGLISTQARQPTIPSDGGTLSYATHEDQNTEHQGADFLEEGRQVSSDPAGHRDEHEHTHITVPQGRADFSSNSPVTPSRPASQRLSQHSDRQPHRAEYPPQSQYSQPPPSTYRPNDRLRPMIGIDRYGRHEGVVIKGEVKKHAFPPVTTQFVR